jgi:hypothetical protein
MGELIFVFISFLVPRIPAEFHRTKCGSWRRQEFQQQNEPSPSEVAHNFGVRRSSRVYRHGGGNGALVQDSVLGYRRSYYD